MAACDKKTLKEKIKENHKTVKNGLYIQMIMDGREGKKLKMVVLFRILNLR